MVEKGYSTQWHWVWNDKCTSQFKSNEPWYFFWCIQIWLGVVKCYLWSLFGNGHGKGPHDKVGVVIKQFLHIEQLNPQTRKLQNVEEAIQFLHEWLSSRPESYYGSMKPFHRTFWHAKVGDVDRDSSLFIYDPIKGTKRIHSIYATNSNNLIQLLVKGLACLCEFCLDSHWSECQNVQWTSKWVSKQLQPQDISYVQEALYESWDGVWQYGL
jgi:hypothetical protein